MIDFHGIRRIFDEQGILWEVWEAHPRLLERRSARDRRRAERADGHDRRVALSDVRRTTLDAAGWLVFRSAREERRRAPIPSGWEMMSDEQLLGVLHGGRLTGPVARQRARLASAPAIGGPIGELTVPLTPSQDRG